MPNFEYIAKVRDELASWLNAEPVCIVPRIRPAGCPAFDFGIFHLEDVGVYKLITLGLSAESMNHPETDSLRVELAITIPEGLANDGGIPPSWLFSELGEWAMMPFQEDTFVWVSQTLANEPLGPIGPESDFVGWLVTWPFYTPDDQFEVDGDSIIVLDLLPIYASELMMACEQGSQELLDRMAEARIPPMFAPGRVDVTI